MYYEIETFATQNQEYRCVTSQIKYPSRKSETITKFQFKKRAPE
jgi:hypothetical protein